MLFLVHTPRGTRDRRDEPSTNWKAHPSSYWVAEDRKEDNSSSAFRVQAFICVICHRLGSGCVFYLKIMGLCVGKKLSGLAARAYRRTRRCGGVRIIFTFPPLIFFTLKCLFFRAVQAASLEVCEDMFEGAGWTYRSVPARRTPFAPTNARGHCFSRTRRVVTAAHVYSVRGWVSRQFQGCEGGIVRGGRGHV